MVCQLVKNNRHKNEYSVLLLYPDYMADTCLETYFTHVYADSPMEGAQFARMEYFNHHKKYMNSPNDLAVLLVIKGHHDDLYDATQDKGI